jgi:hypothetical protein
MASFMIRPFCPKGNPFPRYLLERKRGVTQRGHHRSYYPQLCYRGIAVTQPLDRGIREERCPLGRFHISINCRRFLGLCTWILLKLSPADGKEDTKPSPTKSRFV